MCILTLACLLFLLTGCSKNGFVETEKIESESPPSMIGLINISGIDHPIEKGGFKWERKIGLDTETVQTDHASPNQMADQIEPILVKPNEKIDIKNEENPDIIVYLWNEKERVKEVEQVGNQITAPSSKGKHIYEVLAKWANGTISYTFVLKIQ